MPKGTDKYGFKEFAVEVFQKVNKPLSNIDIWEEGKKLGLVSKLKTEGKTPWNSISAQIYAEIKDKGGESRFKQVSKSPALFALSQQSFNEKDIDNAIDSAEEPENNRNPDHEQYERKLHAVLVKYLYSNKYFSCFTKTIFHEKSGKVKKGKNYWIHPDLIGIHFPYIDDYEKITLNLSSILGEKLYKIYSFEMKVNINSSNLREYYFQAVSNSSWANEGYLVAPNISENDEFINELSLLNNAFGIGVIKLNIEIPEQSEILFYSKNKNYLDINMLDKLISKNDDVKKIFNNIIESNKLSRLIENDGTFDKVLSEEEYEKHKKNLLR